MGLKGPGWAQILNCYIYARELSKYGTFLENSQNTACQITIWFHFIGARGGQLALEHVGGGGVEGLGRAVGVVRGGQEGGAECDCVDHF